MKTIIEFLEFAFLDVRHAISLFMICCTSAAIGYAAYASEFDYEWQRWGIVGFMAVIFVLGWVRVWLIFKRINK